MGIEDGEPEPDADEFQVWPENWQTAKVWLALSGHWRLVVTSTLTRVSERYEGLEHPGIESTLNLMGIEKKRKRRMIFEQIKDMEHAALSVLNGVEGA